MPLTAMLACLLLQNTWVVDDTPGPGVDFPDLPPAVAAAADGDILLVQPGTYSHFTLSGKGLRILGEGASNTIVAGLGTNSCKTTITNVPSPSVAYVDRMTFSGPLDQTPRLTVSGATTRATLADLTVVGGSQFLPLGPPATAIRVFDAQVHLVRCQVSGTGGCSNTTGGCTPGPHGPGRGVDVEGGARVFVGSSTLTGGSGAFSSGLSGSASAQGGAQAVRVFGSVGPVPTFWAGDSSIYGGYGGSIFIPNGFPAGLGAPGVTVAGSFARLSGDSTSLVRGGDGGCGFGGAGGPAISALSGSSVDVHSIPVIGGTDCNTGTPAPSTSGSGITLTAVPLPVLRVTGNLTATGSATISITNGPPNVPFLLAAAGSPAFLTAGPLFIGEILVDPVNWFPLFMGNLSATGEFSVTIPLAGIAPAFVHFPVYLQGIALDPSGTFWRVSNSTVATVRP